MEEPFSPATARRHAEAILDGPGMTVFTGEASDCFSEHGMASQDAINVIRGGRITASGVGGVWRYRARTRRMTVEFSFRGRERGATPTELVVERAWRDER